METLFIYLLKSSGLIAMFYLAYYFLVRKETFFDNNRWFLLSGLITSLLLPLFFIKKVVYVERPKYTMDDLVAYSQQSPVISNTNTAVEAFDWIQLLCLGYVLVAFLLVSKIVLSLISLYRMLYQQQIIQKEQFKLVNLNENIAPFSFFNYIVVNPNLYTSDELKSILLHEKIHSQEKHSIDVLIAKTFCIVFWFNPFVWLYKKAIIQNLEYIADQKAMQQLEDKKSYQRALLKVVSNQNCLSITNNFYQSLIKKRIVMLNKNQSNKRNSLKYALIIPALIGFVLLFQIQTIAQEKKIKNRTITESHLGASITFDAKETNKSLKTIENAFKNEKITTSISKIKRNTNGEITAICIAMKTEDGKKKEFNINQTKPIEKIVLFTELLEDGSYDFGIKQVSEKMLSQMNKRTFENDNNPFAEEKNTLLIINGKEYFKKDMKNFNLSCDGSITQLGSEEAIKIYGNKAKDGALVFNGTTKFIEKSESSDENFPTPPTPPTPPVAPTLNFEVAKFPAMPTPPTPPSGTPLNNEKAWKKYEQKMEEFEKKMEAIEPEIEAYAEKMANIDEQMKPFEKEMEAFEKKMEAFEKEMEIYAAKLDAKMAEKRR